MEGISSESQKKPYEPNITSTEVLLERIEKLEANEDRDGLFALVDEIKLKISDLEDAQRSAPNAPNIQLALVKLRARLTSLSN